MGVERAYIRVLKVGIIHLTKLLTASNSFFRGQAVGLNQLITALVARDKDKAPGQYDDKLNAKADSTTNGTRNVTGGVLVLEDLAADHVADTVAKKDTASGTGALSATGDVAGYERPRKETGENEWNRDKIAAPLRPADGWVVLEQRHAHKSGKGR